MGGQPFVRDETNQYGESSPIPEKPGLRNDHRFDQFLKFLIGILQSFPVAFRLLQPKLTHSQTNRSSNGCAAD